jgi:hypothetical protein
MGNRAFDKSAAVMLIGTRVTPVSCGHFITLLSSTRLKANPQISLYCQYDIETGTFFYNLTESEVSAIESQYLRSA